MSDRERLPPRRASDVFEIEFRNLTYAVSYSIFPDSNRVAEVFIDAPAKGLTPINHDAKDVAVMISLALQYGAPMQAIRDAVTRESNGSPIGVGGAVLDAIAAQLENA